MNYKDNLIKILLLVILLVLLFFIYNNITFSDSRWFLHPDDKTNYVFTNALIKKGRLWTYCPFNEMFDTKSFVPGLSDIHSDGDKAYRFYVPYTPGLFVLLSLGAFFGIKGPSILVSFMGVLGILAVFLIVRELFKNYTISILSAVLLGFSPAYIYWSNMLFNNIPAVALYLFGVLFFIKMINNPHKTSYYILTLVFFSLCVWVRYEFLLIVVLHAVFLIFFIRILEWRKVINALIAGLFIILLILIGNKIMTDNVFGYYKGMASTISEYAFNYPTRFSELDILTRNGYMYIYFISPVLTVIGICGAISFLKYKNRKILAMLVLVGLFTYYYYGKNDGFWGFNQYWLASSYTRYFLIVYAILSILGSLFVVELFTGRYKAIWARSLFLSLIVISHIITSVFALNMTFGLDYTKKAMESYRNVNDYVASMPDNMIIIDGTDSWYEKMIVDRTVFVPYRIGEGKEEKLRIILEGLLERGYELCLLYNDQRGKIKPEEIKEICSECNMRMVESRIDFHTSGSKPIVYIISRNEIKEE